MFFPLPNNFYSGNKEKRLPYQLQLNLLIVYTHYNSICDFLTEKLRSKYVVIGRVWFVANCCSHHNNKYLFVMSVLETNKVNWNYWYDWMYLCPDEVAACPIYCKFYVIKDILHHLPPVFSCSLTKNSLVKMNICRLV